MIFFSWQIVILYFFATILHFPNIGKNNFVLTYYYVLYFLVDIVLTLLVDLAAKKNYTNKSKVFLSTNKLLMYMNFIAFFYFFKVLYVLKIHNSLFQCFSSFIIVSQTN